jgi:hypothetical protein
MNLDQGFVATHLRPHNLNGWDISHIGAPGPITPFDSDPDTQGTLRKRRRKHNKCLGSLKEDPNFILDDDLSMAGVSAMEDKTLVGKAYG